MSEPRTFLDGRVTLHAGDCRAVLREMEDNSIDSVVCDPPYHLQSIVKRFAKVGRTDKTWSRSGTHQRTAGGFMNKLWDGGDIAFQTELWAEVLRVLKPGGYIMAFSSCRTFHRMACAIEDAGFITHPFFAWCFGSGFPKAHNVSKQIDKRGGNGHLSSEIATAIKTSRNLRKMSISQCDEIFCGGTTNWSWFEGRPQGQRIPTGKTFRKIVEAWPELCALADSVEEAERESIGHNKRGPGWFTVQNGHDITAPATDAAREWDGWFYGTQSLKPAIEPVYFGQKPFERGLNGAQNVLKWGTGAINVGASKIPSGDLAEGRTRHGGGIKGNGSSYELPDSNGSLGASRWPANLITDGSDEVLACFPETGVSNGGSGPASKEWRGDGHTVGANMAGATGGLGDSGSAARFFYTAKADSDDRLGSKHPTVKPLDLIQYLVRLITPPNGVCLDLFAGTGTTGESCFREGFRAILIENDPESIADIERRMSLVMEGPVTRANAGMKARGRPRDDGPLFGGSEDAPRFVGSGGVARCRKEQLPNWQEARFGGQTLEQVSAKIVKLGEELGLPEDTRITLIPDEAAE